MSVFWLGAFVALAAWFLFNTFMSMLLYGGETKIDMATIGINVFLLLVSLFMAVLVYVGVTL